MTWLHLSGMLIAVLFSSNVRGDDKKPTRADIAKAGKAATALIEVKSGTKTSFGSAFCVSADGLFITNEHVAKVGEMRLVLDPTGPTEKVFKVKVVRTNSEADLALLSIDPAGRELKPLNLGEDANVVELAPVIAFGFPFGGAFAQDNASFPAMSVNAVVVSSLRRKGKELYRLQLDGALNPGHSGGPVMDDAGMVVGVVVSGIVGSGIAQAIPVSHVKRFVQTPELSLTPPSVTVANQGEPAEFKVRVSSILGAGKGYDVSLTVSDGVRQRVVPMTAAKGSEFKGSVVPVPAAGASTITVQAQFGDVGMTAPVNDRTFKVGQTQVLLSAVDTIEMNNGQSRVTLRNGTKSTGPVTGLDNIEVRFGEKNVMLDLSLAGKVTVSAPAGPAPIRCRISVKQDGIEIGHLDHTLAIAGAKSSSGGGTVVGGRTLTAPTLTSNKTEIDLPDAINDVVVGGAGRYLLLMMAKVRKLAIFDVSAAKILKYIPVDDDNVKVAAGADHFFVVLPKMGTIQRWSFATMEKERTERSPVEGMVTAASMGSASVGPLILAGKKIVFVDPETINEIEYESDGNRGIGMTMINNLSSSQIRTSADGQTIGLWRTSGSPTGVTVIKLFNKTMKVYYDHTSAGHVVPGADGANIFTGQGMRTSEVKMDVGMNERRPTAGICIPAQQGPFYLEIPSGFDMAFERRGERMERKMMLKSTAETKSLATLDEVSIPNNVNAFSRDELGIDKRYIYLPNINLLISVPDNQKLVLQKIDLKEMLEKAGLDYLLTVSEPPKTAAKGKRLEYAIGVMSKRGAVSFQLDSGPKGMAISSDGKLTWDVPADASESAIDVIVSIGDASGKKLFHTFRMTLR